MNAYFVSNQGTGRWSIVTAETPDAACIGLPRDETFVRLLTDDDVAALRGVRSGLCPPEWMRKAQRKGQGVLL